MQAGKTKLDKRICPSSGTLFIRHIKHKDSAL